jgi:hypothetical protein
MKTTWNIIHKEISNQTNENNIKSLKIKNHILHNQISIANEFNNYFLNIAGSTSTKGISEKKKMLVHYNIYLHTLISHLKI